MARKSDQTSEQDKPRSTRTFWIVALVVVVLGTGLFESSAELFEQKAIRDHSIDLRLLESSVGGDAAALHAELKNLGFGHGPSMSDPNQFGYSRTLSTRVGSISESVYPKSDGGTVVSVRYHRAGSFRAIGLWRTIDFPR